MESYTIKPVCGHFELSQGDTCLDTFETQQQAITSATARHWIEANKAIIDMVCDDGYASTTIK